MNIRLALLLFLLLILLPFTALADAQETYLQAENLLSEGKYAEAASLYDSLNAYQDAPKCAMYARACAAIQERKLDEALSVFTYLADFKDSDMLCYLIDVLRMEKDGEYAKAVNACKVPPYSYHGWIRKIGAELDEQYFFREYRSARIRGDYVIVHHAQSGLYGLINMDGLVVIPCEWKDIWYSPGSPYVRVAKGEKYSDYLYGLLSLSSGELVVPCQWKGASYIGSGMAIVKKEDSDGNDLFGLLSLASGELILPCEWRSIEPIGHDWAIAGKEGFYTLVSLTTGETLLPCEYASMEYVSPYSGGDYIVCERETEEDAAYQLIRLSDMKAIIDGAAHIELFHPDYPMFIGLAPDNMVHIFEGSAEQHPPELLAGMEIIREYLAAATLSEDELFLYITEDRVIKLTENTLVDHPLEAADNTQHAASRLRIAKQNDLYGAVDPSGSLVVQYEWDHIHPLSENTLLCFSGETKYGDPIDGESYLIDLISGTKTKVDWMYDRFGWGYGEVGPSGLTKVTKTQIVNNVSVQSYGVINAAGQLVIPCEMYQINLLEDGYILASDSSYHYGVYDASCRQIIPHEYRSISYGNGKFALISGGPSFFGEGPHRLTIIDEAGNILF